MDTLNARGTREQKEKMDMPDGTCVTDPYYVDSIIKIGLKK